MTPAVCPICNSSNISIFLKRKKVPIHQNMIFHDRKSAVESITGNLTMTVCKNCGFVFNKDFNESLLSYDENYDNSQTFSPLFKRYVSKLVHYILEKKFVKNCNIFEVGCGKGFFLRKLVENGRGNRGYGFDPAYDGPLEELEGKIRFYRDYYAPDFVDVKADIVVCRHVIEHVTNPTSLMQDIHKAFKMSQTARVFLETPCVEWILRNNVHFDMFYEHCSLFSESSLESAMQLVGYEPSKTCHIFDEQYLWLEAAPTSYVNDVQFDSGKTPVLAQEFGKKEKDFIESWKEKLDSFKPKPLAIWGAGAKGATFLNLIDPEALSIDCVIDINPKKRGKYIPGTGHEIIGIDQIKSRGVKAAINMNPNYANENAAIVIKFGLNITWI